LVADSGLSALVFAALASKNGIRVKILEAHEHPGGIGHTFQMGNSAKFNAQFHYF
jgi:all-trans-retinol 13,14-reductase